MIGLTKEKGVLWMAFVNFIGSFIFAIIIIVGLVVTLGLIFFFCFFNRARCVPRSSERQTFDARSAQTDFDAASNPRISSVGQPFPFPPTTGAARSNADPCPRSRVCTATTRNPWDTRSTDPIQTELIEVREVKHRAE